MTRFIILSESINCTYLMYISLSLVSIKPNLFIIIENLKRVWLYAPFKGVDFFIAYRSFWTFSKSNDKQFSIMIFHCHSFLLYMKFHNQRWYAVIDVPLTTPSPFPINCNFRLSYNFDKGYAYSHICYFGGVTVPPKQNCVFNVHVLKKLDINSAM